MGARYQPGSNPGSRQEVGMEAEPTRVGYLPTVRDSVAHGPEKRLAREGRMVTVSCTMPEGLFARGRSAGIVFSRLLQRATEAELGGSDLARIESEIAHHLEQARILSATKEQLLAKKQAEEEAAAGKRARLDAINAIADMFYTTGREKERRVYNLAWLEGRINATPALRGTAPEELLSLILTLQEKGSGQP